MFKFSVPLPSAAPFENWKRLVTLPAVYWALNLLFSALRIADSQAANGGVPFFAGITNHASGSSLLLMKPHDLVGNYNENENLKDANNTDIPHAPQRKPISNRDQTQGMNRRD